MGGCASRAAGRKGCGVPFVEEATAEPGLRSGDGTGLSELERWFEGGTTSGEAAMLEARRLGGGGCDHGRKVRRRWMCAGTLERGQPCREQSQGDWWP